MADDELELVVVATRFTDGNKLKIEEQYPVFTPTTPTPPTPPIMDPKKPGGEDKRDPEINKPRENVIITPPQDKYRQGILQKREPAYVRLRAQFEVNSEPQQMVNYQQQSVVREEHTTTEGSGELQF